MSEFAHIRARKGFAAQNLSIIRKLVFSFPADCNTIACNDKRLLHNQKKMHTFALTNARMAESVDATVSNTVGVIRAGSTPAPGTRPWRRAIFSTFFLRVIRLALSVLRVYLNLTRNKCSECHYSFLSVLTKGLSGKFRGLSSVTMPASLPLRPAEFPRKSLFV